MMGEFIYNTIHTMVFTIYYSTMSCEGMKCQGLNDMCVSLNTTERKQFSIVFQRQFIIN